MGKLAVSFREGNTFSLEMLIWAIYYKSLTKFKAILGGFPFSTKRGAPRLRLGNSGPTCAVKDMAPEQKVAKLTLLYRRDVSAPLCGGLKAGQWPGSDS